MSKQDVLATALHIGLCKWAEIVHEKIDEFAAIRALTPKEVHHYHSCVEEMIDSTLRHYMGRVSEKVVDHVHKQIIEARDTSTLFFE